MSPTILNMVVEAVIHHWVTVVEGEVEVPEGFGRSVKNLSALFYANGGLLDPPWPSRL